ncbi:hypothetical protein N9166_01745 [bacterium]|nr:hypothetical protein [bacterium]
MPNLFAYLVMMACVPVVIAIFAWLPPRRASVVSLLGAALVLPVRVSFDVSGLPPLDKSTLPPISALLGCLLFHRRLITTRKPFSGCDVLAAVLLVGSIGTMLANRDVVRWGDHVLPPLRTWDAFSLAARALLTMGVPFYLGRVFFRKPADLRVVLSGFAAACLIYFLPILYEVRMSPQLHSMVYGVQAMHFVGAHRFGGWRPVVFMRDGLELALLVAAGLISTVGLARSGFTVLRVPAALVSVALGALLVLCKALGAAVLAVPITLAAALLPSRAQTKVAAALAAVVLAYPVLRVTEIFPKERAISLAAAVSTERSASLAFRFRHEDMLLERATSRPWFGWGGFGRNRVLDERTGRDLSVTDGLWIITFGKLGVFGFVGTFGLLLSPVFLLALRIRRVHGRWDRLLATATAWIVVLYAADSIPNSMLGPFAIFTAGALAGVLEESGTRRGRRSSHVARGRPVPARHSRTGEREPRTRPRPPLGVPTKRRV